MLVEGPFVGKNAAGDVFDLVLRRLGADDRCRGLRAMDFSENLPRQIGKRVLDLLGKRNDEAL